MTCLNAYIEANLNASSLESTAWEAPSVKTTRRCSTGCPINEPLYVQEETGASQQASYQFIFTMKLGP